MMQRGWTKLLALLLAFALAGCATAGTQQALDPSSSSSQETASPGAFTLLDALAARDGQTGHTPWFGAAALSWRLEDESHDQGEDHLRQLQTTAAQEAFPMILSLALDPDSRQEGGLPSTGEGSMVEISYNTLEQSENQLVDLFFSQDGRVYLADRLAPGAACVSYALLGGAQAGQDAWAAFWDALEELPYQVAFSTALVSPQSQVAHLYFSNNGALPITLGDLTLSLEGEEVYADSAWAGQTVAAGESLVLSIPLEALPNHQDGAVYEARLAVTRTRDGAQESYQASAALTLSSMGDLLFPVPNPMTPENQRYCDQYLVFIYSLFQLPWDEEHPLTQEGLSPLLVDSLAHGCYRLDTGRDLTLDYLADGGVPAQVLEGCISRYLPLDPAAYRSYFAQDGDGTRYDPQTQTYFLMGGFGGAYPSPHVDASRLEGDLLVLECSWYSPVDSSLAFTHTLTLRLGEGGPFYLSNQPG